MNKYTTACLKTIQKILNIITKSPVDFGRQKFRGVYVVVLVNVKAQDFEVKYIGTAVNIYKRTICKDHHYSILYNQYSDNEDYNLVCFSIECASNRIVIEEKLIKLFRPDLNVLHNTGKKRGL